MYGEGRQGRRPTSLFVGLTPLSDSSPCGKRRQKMKKNERKRKTEGEKAYLEEERERMGVFLPN